ncbi:MAG: zf-HC2 domain-containing protein [Gemmatimonadota bacterium]|nr:MAG: zf-HC2 domain-containing protein [Gemmatimonadota bacterium]
MKACKEFKKLYVEYLFGELEAEKRGNFEGHLSQCSNCASELAEMRRTLEMMGHSRRVEPPEEYWDTYWSRLSTRMEKELAPKTRAKIGIWGRIKESFPTIPSPAYRWAAVAAALVLGIVIGRYLVTSGGVKEAPVAQSPAQPEQEMYAQTVDSRAEKYLEKSKIFLLGFVNTNGELEEGDFDMSRQRDISQGLIQEASYLKDNLQGHSQQRLRTLIEDLETILIEIANLEEQEDLPDIELIRDGIDRRGILLKINVHQMKDEFDREDMKSKKERDKTLI